MTSFQRSDIPTSITDVESLMVWGASILAEQAPDSRIRVGTNSLDEQFRSGPFTFPLNPDVQDFWAVVCYLPLENTWRSNGAPWAGSVAEVNTGPIPPAYTS